MNPLSYYERSREPWSPEELSKLRREYETELQNIIKIGDLHKRTPGCIAHKLKNMGLVPHSTLSRGHREYKLSALYYEICKKYQEEDALKEQRKEERRKQKEEKEKVRTMVANPNIVNLLSVFDNSDAGALTKNAKSLITEEIKALKEEVQDLKKDMKQMLSYITQLYEFETNQ